jgi:hypothetical protein
MDVIISLVEGGLGTALDALVGYKQFWLKQ